MRTRQVGRTEILLCKVGDLIFCHFSEILDQCKIVEKPFNENGISLYFVNSSEVTFAHKVADLTIFDTNFEVTIFNSKSHRYITDAIY